MPLGSVCSPDRTVSYCVVTGRSLFPPLVSPTVKGEWWLYLKASNNATPTPPILTFSVPPACHVCFLGEVHFSYNPDLELILTEIDRPADTPSPFCAGVIQAPPEGLCPRACFKPDGGPATGASSSPSEQSWGAGEESCCPQGRSHDDH